MKSTKGLTVMTAIERLMFQLAQAEYSDIENLNTCLQLGAGQIWLFEPETVFTHPSGLIPSRRLAYHTLVETIYLDAWPPESPNDPEAPFQACHAGAWESVLVTLVLEGDWGKIEETAKELMDAC